MVVLLWYCAQLFICIRQATDYGMSVGDHRVAWWWKGVMCKQISYMTLIEVHSIDHTSQSMSRNYYMYVHVQGFPTH